jgi:dCMP deaminase
MKLKSATCEDCSNIFQNGNPRCCKDGIMRCKKCRNKKQRQNFIEKHGTTPAKTYGPRYKEQNRDRALKRTYGISLKDYGNILTLQGGGCAICKVKPTDSDKNFPVDHDHKTGQIRGILCRRCNMVLGQLKDDPGNIRSAVSYLLRTTARRSWDQYFLDIAGLASIRSKDPSTQVGAVIVKNNNILSTGYNGFPRGVNDNDESRYERPEKYLWTIHAEENAIFNASRNGVALEDSILYVTPMHPCLDCAKAIAQSGIKEVVVEQLFEHEAWLDNFKKAGKIFKAARIVVRGPE